MVASARIVQKISLVRTHSQCDTGVILMNTNVASFFYMTQQVIPQMKKQNSGHVVNISAVLVDQPSGALPAVLAVLSKSPMPAVSKALALRGRDRAKA